MTPWQWWIGTYGDVEYEGIYSLGPYASRNDAIHAGYLEWPGQLLGVVEARSSTAAEYYDAPESIPFLRQRNSEIINPVMEEVLERAAKAVEERELYWTDMAQKTPPRPWWAFWRTDVRDDYESMASELNILAKDIRNIF